MLKKTTLPILAIAATLVSISTALVSQEEGDPAKSNFVFDAPGLVVEYNRPPPTFGRPSAETWKKHGDLVRVDHVADGGPMGPPIGWASYHRVGKSSVFSVGRYPNGSLANLHIMRDPLLHPPHLAERTFSGVTEKYLGEDCKRWQRSVTLPSGQALEQIGCVTQDGVELWWRNADVDAIFASTITRAPVSSHDVQAPIDLLDFGKWMDGAPPGSHERDYEVMLTSTNMAMPTKVVRRSGNWVLEHQKEGSSETLTVTNIQAGTDMIYSKSKGSEAQISINRRLFGRTPEVMAAARERMPDRAGEMVVGERCQWWNLSKGLSDYLREECLTEDDAPLIVITGSRGSGWTMKATKLTRGPIPIELVLPPAEIISPAIWGLAEPQ